MEVEVTGEFEKDIKKIGQDEKERIKNTIIKIKENPDAAKPLHHLNSVFSIRIKNKRLVYQFLRNENKIILLFFKSRENVYDYLK